MMSPGRIFIADLEVFIDYECGAVLQEIGTA